MCQVLSGAGPNLLFDAVTRMLSVGNSLGQSRLLKAVRARHRNGPVVIKMFIKHDPSFSLRAYIRRLKGVPLLTLYDCVSSAGI